jgi:hypothetical protein
MNNKSIREINDKASPQHSAVWKLLIKKERERKRE